MVPMPTPAPAIAMVASPAPISFAASTMTRGEKRFEKPRREKYTRKHLRLTAGLSPQLKNHQRGAAAVNVLGIEPRTPRLKAGRSAAELYVPGGSLGELRGGKTLSYFFVATFALAFGRALEQ